ncbi:MAG: Smr/MutS family protein [Gammaproteobacteria bacterium]|jgi:DNA-nicking Smr family endonuclease
MNDQTDKDKEDSDLFRQAMQGVTPLKTANRVKFRPAPVKVRRPPGNDDAERQQRFTQGLFTEACPDHLYFERAGGVQKTLLKKLRNGKLAIDSTLDLHGLTVEQANEQLSAFLEECRHFGHRTVIIVHGKGFRSQSKAVIKPMVNRWLRQSEEVLAFCSAQPNHGGTGAVYVLLRKTRVD